MTCPECNYGNKPEDETCSMCQAPLNKKAAGVLLQRKSVKFSEENKAPMKAELIDHAEQLAHGGRYLAKICLGLSIAGGAYWGWEFGQLTRADARYVGAVCGAIAAALSFGITTWVIFALAFLVERAAVIEVTLKQNRPAK